MIKKRCFPLLCAVVVFLVVTASGAQTNVRLSDITPGTERVTLVSNGNFESGSSGWTKVQDMFAEPTYWVECSSFMRPNRRHMPHRQAQNVPVPVAAEPQKFVTIEVKIK